MGPVGKFSSLFGIFRGGALCSAVWLVALPLAAQTLPVQPLPVPPIVPPGVVVPTPSELAPGRAPAATDPGDLPHRRSPPRAIGKQDDLAVDVTAFEVAPDAPAEVRAALASLTQPFVGPKRGFEDLANAAAEVTRFMQRELGYYLGYAYIPEQEPVGGVVRIEVLEGRLDQVELKWSDDLPVRRDVVEAYLAHLQPGAILRVRDVERVVFLVNDLRGLTARFDVKAGSLPGTATLVVTPKAEPNWAGKVDLDANGSRFLGVARAGGLLSANSLAGRGDALTLNALASFNGGLGFGLLGYTLPVGSDGLKVGTSLSFVHYKLDRTEFPLGVNGDAVNLTAYGLYPWVRSRNLNLFVLGSAEHKDYTDRNDFRSDKKRIDSLTIGATGDFRDSVLTGGVNTYEANLAVGQVDYPAGKPAGLDDDSHYTKLIFAYNRLQNLVDSRLLLYVAARAQQAFNNLDTTEQFRIGGPDSVRAYAPGEGTGDSGQVLTLELRLLPTESLMGRMARDIVFGVFYDVGHVTFRHDTSSPSRPSNFVNTATYSGAGLSVAWVRGNEYAFRLSLAKPIQGTPTADTQVRDPRVYAQFSKQF